MLTCLVFSLTVTNPWNLETSLLMILISLVRSLYSTQYVTINKPEVQECK